MAIVSPMAGTTRDVLTSNLDIGGYPIILCDTAGLRTTQDPVESQGLKRGEFPPSGEASTFTPTDVIVSSCFFFRNLFYTIDPSNDTFVSSLYHR